MTKIRKERGYGCRFKVGWARRGMSSVEKEKDRRLTLDHSLPLGSLRATLVEKRFCI